MATRSPLCPGLVLLVTFLASRPCNQEELLTRRVRFEGSLGTPNTLLYLDDALIYSHRGNYSEEDLRHNTGVHMVVLHQSSFEVLFSQIFYTAQPSADVYLYRKLCSVHIGRVVVLMGSANFTIWLRDELQISLYDSGTILGPEVAVGEYWVAIMRKRGLKCPPNFHPDFTQDKIARREENATFTDTDCPAGLDRKGGCSHQESVQKKSNATVTNRPRMTKRDAHSRGQLANEVLFEAVSTVRYYRRIRASPFKFHTYVESRPEINCEWHREEELQALAKFCKTYDGYGYFCACELRAPLKRPPKPILKDVLHQVIPVVIVTSTRLTHVMRQVRQIRETSDSKETPILLSVDGFNPEAKDLAKLLSLDVAFHDNKQKKGTKYRVNEHIKWSINKVLEFYQKAKHFILLEDDLELAPDFISYFHQLALLMDVDDTISVVNAYNYNAFEHTAFDPTQIYLVQSYPYYGWMTSRKIGLQMTKHWAPVGEEADWDLYLHYRFLKNSFIVIPEVPRTKHISGGGVHVSGFEQETDYNARPLSNLYNVTLQMQRRWSKAYSLDIMKFLVQAQLLNITQNPCTHPPLTKDTNGKYLLYLDLDGDDDIYSSYYTICRCFGFYDTNKMEQFDGVFLRKFYKNEILMVSCPVSPYCTVQSNRSIIYAPTSEAIDEAEKRPFKRTYTNSVYLIRAPAKDLKEEVLFDNAIPVTITLYD